MKIKYLKLVNFKRFPLNELEIFEKEFNHKLTLITGPNGVGKSSLINELTPLPSDKNNFNKNGYKEIHIEKDGDLYILISDFSSGTKYYFLLNDKELNLSNKITIQKELVFNHFNINQYTHDMLVGIENFTDMSLLNRKKLFNSITHLNIDSILRNYNKLKDELKNNEYLLKNQLSLLQSEEQKIANKDHINELITNNERIKEFINLLLDMRTSLYKYKESKPIDEIYNSYVDLNNKLKKGIRKYYTFLTSYPVDDTGIYKSLLDNVEFKLNNLYKELEKKEEEKKILDLNKEHNLEELNSKQNTLSINIDNYIKGLNILTNLNDLNINIPSIKESLYKVETVLPDIVRNIPTNIDKKYSVKNYNNYLENKNRVLDRLNSMLVEELEIEKEIKHIKLHQEELVCPQCLYKWIPKDTEKKLKDLKNTQQELLKEKNKLRSELNKLDSEIKKQIEYLDLYKHYISIRNSTKNILSFFWHKVDENNCIFDNPIEILTLLKDINADIVHIEQIQKLKNEKEELEKNIDILTSMKDTNLLKIEYDIELLNDYIKELQLEKIKIKQNIKDNELANSIRDILTSIQRSIESNKEDIYISNVSYTINNVLSIIESELSKYKVILIENEKEISNYNNIKYTISNYERNIDDIKTNIKVLKIILNELSPKNGLIAKSISNFLNIIITNINNIIKSIWDYKMILTPINIESDTLNYKFKVEIEDKITIEDINKVSSGMKEVINLSFKIVLYKLLKLENYPIFLDEFGVRLDKLHRSKISELIFKMINSNNYSQIFLITHLDMAYNVFKDVEVLELGT